MAQMELPAKTDRRGFSMWQDQIQICCGCQGLEHANKQLAVIPTMLRGRLIDYYVELDHATKDDLKLLKAALQESLANRHEGRPLTCF